MSPRRSRRPPSRTASRGESDAPEPPPGPAAAAPEQLRHPDACRNYLSEPRWPSVRGVTSARTRGVLRGRLPPLQRRSRSAIAEQRRSAGTRESALQSPIRQRWRGSELAPLERPLTPPRRWYRHTPAYVHYYPETARSNRPGPLELSIARLAFWIGIESMH